MSNRKQKDWQQARFGDTRIGERFALVTEFQRRIRTCIYTLREDRIRTISIRRVRHEEEIRYPLG